MPSFDHAGAAPAASTFLRIARACPGTLVPGGSVARNDSSAVGRGVAVGERLGSAVAEAVAATVAVADGVVVGVAEAVADGSGDGVWEGVADASGVSVGMVDGGVLGSPGVALAAGVGLAVAPPEGDAAGDRVATVGLGAGLRAGGVTSGVGWGVVRGGGPWAGRSTTAMTSAPDESSPVTATRSPLGPTVMLLGALTAATVIF